MSKGSRGAGRGPGFIGLQDHAPPTGGANEPELLRDLRERVRASHPLPLFELASSLLSVLDPRERNPFEPDARTEGPSRDELIGSFLSFRRPEVSALLTAIAELTDDEVEERRIRRELAERSHKTPRWLRRLVPLQVLGVLEMSHVLGDGDNVLLDVATGNDDRLTALVYIDHNMGTLVKDAFVIDQPLEDVARHFEELGDDEQDTVFTELDPADARARITQAIELGAITWPPLETETWPACRPLVEWIVGELPEGGTGYVRPEWSEEDRDELVEEFLDSGYAPTGSPDDTRALADVMIWFACDYGPGDPLRWSPVSVEIFLSDFLARKTLFADSTLRRGPAVLRSFVRFAHERRGIRPELTEQTLENVERYTPELLEQLDEERDDTHTMLMELIEQRGLDQEGVGFIFDEDGRPVPIATRLHELLLEAVGDEQTLAELDVHPLPDEPLELGRLPQDVRERVERISALADGCCDELLDTEHRTACRRLVVDVAASDPEIFRRRGRDDTAAAAIVWIVAKANNSLQQYRGALTAKRLLEWFGLSGSVSQRADTMLRAIGVPSRADSGIRLRSPAYLTSQERRRIVERRDRDR